MGNKRGGDEHQISTKIKKKNYKNDSKTRESNEEERMKCFKRKKKYVERRKWKKKRSGVRRKRVHETSGGEVF